MMQLNTIYTLFIVVIILLGCEREKKLQTREERTQKLNELREKSTEIILQIKKLEKEIDSEQTDQLTKQKLKRIESTVLQLRTFEHYIETQGNVDSEQNVEIVPQIAGVILKKYIKEGDKISKGQILVEIDAESIRKNIAEINSRLALAKTIYNRQKNLWEQEIGSEIQYLQKKNEKETLEKSLETLKNELEKAYIKSPIDGILDEFFLNLGEMANPQIPLARIVNLSSVKVTAEVPETYVQSVRKNDMVWIKFTVLEIEKAIPIRQIGRFINSANRTFKIHMKMDNKKGWLRPNTLAIVKIRDFVAKNVLIVPSHLIQKSTTGEFFIYTVTKSDEDNIVDKVTVEIGKSYRGETVITKGLKAGDQIVTKGYNEVVDKELVNLINF